MLLKRNERRTIIIGSLIRIMTWIATIRKISMYFVTKRKLLKLGLNQAKISPKPFSPTGRGW